MISRGSAVSSSNIPSPNVCVTGESIPSNTTVAPAHSIHAAPLSGNNRRRASANWRQAWPSARSRRLARARSENCISTLSGFRVGAVVYRHQVGERNLRVFLGGGQARVAQQFLDGAKIG